MMSVAAVIVTHNAARWLPALLDSISAQTHPVDHVIVIDDHSTDATDPIARAFGAQIVPAKTNVIGGLARTGQNFEQGALIARREQHELVVLSDHDDTWHPSRVAHQVGLMRAYPQAAVVASDGILIDERGDRIIDDSHGPQLQAPRTLRSAFPVPSTWLTADAPTRFRIALRHSIATGGASMIRPVRLDGALDVPASWLHDRWWSLAATAMDAMIIDDTAVIDYQVRAGQQLGLDRGDQAKGSAHRLATGIAQAPDVMRRIKDLRTGLLPVAADAVQPELTRLRLLRSLL